MSGKVEKMYTALRRANTRLLLVAVMIFQCTAMTLIAFQDGEINMQALQLAAALPLVTFILVNTLDKRHPIDRSLLIMVLFLCSVGIVTLSDIAKSDETPRTQAIYALIGIGAMLVGMGLIRVLTPRKRLTRAMMVLCLIALLTPWLPAPFGKWYQGARNWLYIGPISGQPSEFMKPILIIALAAGFSNHPRFVKCLVPIGFAALCCVILLSERDLGALLLYFLTTVFMYYVATSNLFITFSGLGMGAFSAVIAYKALPYVQKRVAIWQNPWSDPTDTGFQLVQALIAIGSGGLFGMGLGLGKPRSIPLYYSDFIFAAITEEFGLIFAIGLLAVYVLIIMRGLIVAANARSSFHSLTAFGIVIMLGLQTMLIVGGNTKLLPLTGVTLPLVCYGGSSLVSTFFSMGILLGISAMNLEDEARDIEQRGLKEELL